MHFVGPGAGAFVQRKHLFGQRKSIFQHLGNEMTTLSGRN